MIILAAAIFAVAAITCLHEWGESHPDAPEKAAYIAPRTITSGTRGHAKDAAETDRLNRQMLEQHGGQ